MAARLAHRLLTALALALACLVNSISPYISLYLPISPYISLLRWHPLALSTLTRALTPTRTLRLIFLEFLLSAHKPNPKPKPNPNSNPNQAPACFAVWVSASRVRDNWHHPSDVVFGMLLGGTCAAIAFGSYFGPVLTPLGAPADRARAGYRALA